MIEFHCIIVGSLRRTFDSPNIDSNYSTPFASHPVDSWILVVSALSFAATALYVWLTLRLWKSSLSSHALANQIFQSSLAAQAVVSVNLNVGEANTSVLTLHVENYGSLPILVESFALSQELTLLTEQTQVLGAKKGDPAIKVKFSGAKAGAHRACLHLSVVGRHVVTYYHLRFDVADPGSGSLNGVDLSLEMMPIRPTKIGVENLPG